jgi:hypothetical protein
MDISEVRGLFPDREFPTDEEIAGVQAAREQEAQAAAQAQAEAEAAEAARIEEIQQLEARLAELRGETTEAQG